MLPVFFIISGVLLFGLGVQRWLIQASPWPRSAPTWLSSLWAPLLVEEVPEDEKFITWFCIPTGIVLCFVGLLVPETLPSRAQVSSIRFTGSVVCALFAQVRIAPSVLHFLCSFRVLEGGGFSHRVATWMTWGLRVFMLGVFLLVINLVIGVLIYAIVSAGPRPPAH